jgi:UDP-2,3-diacylglucosamine hydrolase
VSDAHYNHKRDYFLKFLQDIDSGEIETTQLILVGDMFDLLVSKVNYTISYNKKLIDILNSISTKIEVIYFEGNHDFCLDGLFDNIKIYSIQNQPQLFEYNNKKIAISHGDFATNDIIYNIYLKLIRNKYILIFLNIIDFCINNYISKKIISNQIKKPKCNYKIEFESLAKRRIKHYKDVEYILEGHFHQDKSIKIDNTTYINLPPFVCSKKYIIVKDII